MSAPDVPDNSAHVTALEGHIEILKADVAKLEAQPSLGGADLEAERARNASAIEAFSALADRLDKLAAERARPWWRRLAL
jgi:hypothetical protein